VAHVWIPALMRDLTDGAAEVDVPGQTVGQVIEALDARFSGVRDRLCDGDRLAPAITAWVNGRAARLGLRERVGEDSEVQFLPAISGG